MKDNLDIFDINDCIRQVYEGNCASSLTVATQFVLFFSVFITFIIKGRNKATRSAGLCGPDSQGRTSSLVSHILLFLTHLNTASLVDEPDNHTGGGDRRGQEVKE